MRRAVLLTILALALACNDEAGPASATRASDAATTTATTAATDAATTTSTPTTGEPEDGLRRCQPTCMADADCNIGGDDIGFRCITGVCRPPPCTDDAACVLSLSGWTTPCASQAACDEGLLCVDVGGEGRCARAPGMFFQCADLGLDERLLPAISGDMSVTVCGVSTASCVAGACIAPCTSDAVCPAEQGLPRCELATGACVCAEDRDCQDTDKPGLIVCIDGRCGCRSNMDCTGGTNVDTCYDGACGCAADASCSAQIFDGVTQRCEPA